MRLGIPELLVPGLGLVLEPGLERPLGLGLELEQGQELGLVRLVRLVQH